MKALKTLATPYPEALGSLGPVPPGGRPQGTEPLPGLSSLGSQLAAAAGQGHVTWPTWKAMGVKWIAKCIPIFDEPPYVDYGWLYLDLCRRGFHGSIFLVGAVSISTPIYKIHDVDTEEPEIKGK